MESSISRGITPAEAAGLFMITRLTLMQPSGVSFPPCIVTPVRLQNIIFSVV